MLAGHTTELNEHLTTEVQELEAETVSYLIFNAFGCPSKSPEYLALYQQDYTLLASLTRITEVFTQIYMELASMIDSEDDSSLGSSPLPSSPL